MSWRLVYTKRARQDAKKASASGLKDKIQTLLDLLEQDPYTNPPPYKKLVGDFTGAYSRRVTIHHRLVYEVIDALQTVKILRCCPGYFG